MDLIKHRVNRIAELDFVDPAWGIEVDIRSRQDPKKTLHLAHDPFQSGDDLAPWLAKVAQRGIRGPLILNTKEDGLEARCLELLQEAGLSNFFFLDTALPTLVKWTIVGSERRFAMRLSAHEPAALVRGFIGKAAWLWVDCFGGEPLEAAKVEEFKGLFKICLVSPELHLGLTPNLAKSIAGFAALRPLADAVCTKAPEFWR